MDDKLNEINYILNSEYKPNINKIINKIKKKYKQLENFNYVDNVDFFKTAKRKYLYYVDFNYNLYYGGIFYKIEERDDDTFIFLVKNKKVWSISFNNNFIFETSILTENQKMRKEFEEFLLKNSKE